MAVAVEPGRIRHRKFFLVFDAFEQIVGVLTSPVAVVMRFLMAVIFLLIALLRVEHSPMAAWVDRDIMQLDKCSQATAAVVKLARTHQNPVLCTFVSLLVKEVENAKQSQSSSEPAEEG